MRENRPYGLEGGEPVYLASLPLSKGVPEIMSCPQLACPTGSQGSLDNEPDSPVTRGGRLALNIASKGRCRMARSEAVFFSTNHTPCDFRCSKTFGF